MLNDTRFVYLEDRSVELLGLTFYGYARAACMNECALLIAPAAVRRSPWQPEFGSWAFNLDRGEACAAKWRAIPAGVDVLITHGPPLCHGDLCLPGKQRAGCVDMLIEIEARIKPK